MDLSTFLQLIKAAKTIEEIVQQQLGEILKQIGDSQLEAAIKSIQDMKYSNNPLQEAGYAIGNLQSAHTLLQKSVEKLPRFAFIGYDERAAKVIEVSFLIATCYAYQQNTQLVHRYAEQTRQEFTDYAAKLAKMSGIRIALDTAGGMLTGLAGILMSASGRGSINTTVAASKGMQSMQDEVHIIEARMARLPSDKTLLEEQLARLEQG